MKECKYSQVLPVVSHLCNQEVDRLTQVFELPATVESTPDAQVANLCLRPQIVEIVVVVAVGSWLEHGLAYSDITKFNIFWSNYDVSSS